MYRRRYPQMSRKRRRSTLYRRRLKKTRRVHNRAESKHITMSVIKEQPISRPLTSEGASFRAAYHSFHTGPSVRGLLTGSVALGGFQVAQGTGNDEYLGGRINLKKSKMYWQLDFGAPIAGSESGVEVRFLCFKTKRGLNNVTTADPNPDLDLLSCPGRGYADDAIGPTVSAPSANDFMVMPLNTRLYSRVYEKRFVVGGKTSSNTMFRRFIINLNHNKTVQMSSTNITNYNTQYQCIVFIRPIGNDFDADNCLEASVSGFTTFTDC